MKKYLDILENIMNGLDAIIMATIPETGEILFVNDRKKELFGVVGTVEGKLCYELLHHSNDRCVFCAYAQLAKEPDNIVKWEARHPVTGQAHRMTSLLIDWPGGKKAHLEYGVDITDKVYQQEILERVLDAVDAFIYVSDTDTDDIIFVNKKLETGFGVARDLIGSKCWKHLQPGMEKRCDFCSKSKLLENNGVPIISERYDSIVNRTFNVIDRLIDWPDGRRVHMEQAVDVTETKRAQSKLQWHEKMLSAINKATLILLRRSNGSFADAMNEGISLIDDIVDIDRMSVFRNAKKTDGWYMTQLYRWQKKTGGTITVLPQLIDTPYATLAPNLEKRLEVDESIGGIVRFMPEAAALQRFGCVTVWIVPVFDDGKFWGTVFFERLREEAFTEDETDTLRSASVMLVNAVIRNEEAETVRHATENAMLMLDATPLGCVLWNTNRKIIDCNEAAVMLFGAKSKVDFLESFFDCLPECQPDGHRSDEQLLMWVNKAFDTGRCVFQWTLQTLEGTPIPAEITLVRVKYRNDFVVAAYSRDLRDHNRMMREIDYKNRLLQTVNRMSAIILKSKTDTFEDNLLYSMSILTEAVDADRMYVWKNYYKDGGFYCSQIYEWSGRAESQQHYALAAETLYSDIVPGWKELLSKGHSINGIVREMNEYEQTALSPQGILSILIVPIFIEGYFWGFVGFDDCHNERIFSGDEEVILRSASELIASAVAYTHLEMKADKIYYDPLTGIYNRRFIDENLPRLIQTLSRSDSSLSLMMIDIDCFKSYNDLYGHVEGDHCLKEIAGILKDNVTRSGDFVARYGGEEFVAVLPNTNESGARLIAHQLIENVRMRNIYHEKNGEEKRVTISIGFTTGKATHSQESSVYIQRADEMLYESKKNGRNRYTFASL